MFSRENLDWMNEAPKMSYNETLGRPVFVNREAFYICLSGLGDPTVFEQVEFELDEHFEKHYKNRTGRDEIDPKAVSQYIGNLVDESNNDYKNIPKEDEGVNAFLVPKENPNATEDDEIRWFNTQKLEKIKQKHEKRVDLRTQVGDEHELSYHETNEGTLAIEGSEEVTANDILAYNSIKEITDEAAESMKEVLKTLKELPEENEEKT